jgi:D-alanine--poly(phosphoribitol) ligase subunit 1
MQYDNLTQMVYEAAQSYPDNLAIWARGKTVTYREFRDRAIAISNALVVRGIQPKDRVAILSHRTDTVYVGILGALFAGATYVALNPRFPMARNSMILQESGATGLIIDDRSRGALGPLLAKAGNVEVVVTPESDTVSSAVGCKLVSRSMLGDGSEQPGPHLDASGDDLAYCVFTSGTTGKPKGVQITHDNVLAYLRNIVSAVTLTEPDDRVIQIVDVTFDVSVHDMFTAWTNGAGIISIPENAALMSARFVREHGVTQWFSVPSTARLLQEAGFLEPNSFPSIRSSIFAGEPLVASVADAWMRAVGNSPVFNLYGPTEGTISLCAKKYAPGEFAPHEIVSLGEPFAGNRMGIFDPETNAPVSEGSRGEICFTGNQVTPGYWRAPDLNSKRFFTTADNACWYKTGDLGRYEAGRGFLYAGRVDDQVKIRGFRVELGEIEGVVRSACGVNQVAVIPWPLSKDGNATGCVAFVPKPANGSFELSIRSACVQRLPDYMVPSRLIFVDQLPLNANGKTDYNVLRSHPALGT